MKKRFGIVAVALIGSLAPAAPALAVAKGKAVQSQTRSMIQTQTKQLKTGAGTQTGSMRAKTQAGNAYGPGNVTGNGGVGPKDGKGYGVPAKR